MLSSSTVDHLRNRLWSGSWRSICVNSRQNDSPHIRFFALKRGRKSERSGNSRALRELSAHVLVWTDARKARNVLICFPLKFTKTARKRSLVKRVFRLSMDVLLMIGADAPTFRADFGS